MSAWPGWYPKASSDDACGIGRSEPFGRMAETDSSGGVPDGSAGSSELSTAIRVLSWMPSAIGVWPPAGYGEPGSADSAPPGAMPKPAIVFDPAFTA